MLQFDINTRVTIMMRYLSIVLVSLFILQNVHADETECARMIDKSIQYINAHEDEVWPGFKISTIPTIITFLDSPHFYAFNFTPKAKQWHPVSINNDKVYYMDADYLGVNNDESNYKDIDGQHSYIYRFDGCTDLDSITYNTRAFVNERFNFYLENESKFPVGSLDLSAQQYDGFNQVNNVEYAYLEEEALKNYLLSANIEALKNYIAIHQYRTSLLSKENQAYEKISNIRSAISAYVSIKSLNLSDAEFVKQTINVFTKQIKCPVYDDVHDIYRCLTFGHFQLVGPGIGYALDKTSKSNWKTLTESDGASLDKILQDSMPMTLAEVNQRLVKSKQEYHFTVIKNAVEKNLVPYLYQLNKTLNEYKNLKGVVIDIETRNCHLSAYTHKSEQDFDINSQETLYTDFDGQTGCASDRGKVLMTFKKIPYLYKIGTIFFNRFKPDIDTIIFMDGKEIQIKDLIQTNAPFNFHKLTMTNKFIDIKIDGEASLAYSNGKISILFDGKESQTEH